MKKLTQSNVDNINTFLLASLFLNNYLNLFFIFGFESDLRRILVIFFSFIYSIFCLAVFINISKLDVVFIKKTKKYVFLLLLLMAIYALFLSNSLNSYFSFFIYLIPILIFFLLNLYDSKFRLSSINYTTIIVLIGPATLFYFLRFFLSKSENSILDIGNVSYLVIGYFYLLLFVTVYTLINVEHSEKRNLKTNVYSFIFLIAFCFNIINSGAKGPLISLFIFIVYDFSYNLFLMRKLKPNILIIFFTSLFLTFCFSINNSGLNRFKSFIWETAYLLSDSSQIETVIPEVIVDNDLGSQVEETPSEVIVDNDLGSQVEETPSEVIVDNDLGSQVEDAPLEVNNSFLRSIHYLVSLNENEEKLVQILVESGDFLNTIENVELNVPELRDTVVKIRKSSISARKILFYTSIKEISMNPIGGMGLFGFQMKYGTYPHNLLLEILTDFGLVLGLPTLLIITIFFIYIALVRKLSSFETLIRNLIIVTMPFLMVSGTFYYNQIFFLFIFYVLYKVPKLFYSICKI